MPTPSQIIINILNLAKKIQQGQADVNKYLSYADYSYDDLASLGVDGLMAELQNNQTICAATTDFDPSNDHPIDKLHHAWALHVAPFLLRYTWQKMNGNVLVPKVENSHHYTHFHELHDELYPEYHSQEMFDFLGVTEAEFGQVDQSNAMTSIAAIFYEIQTRFREKYRGAMAAALKQNKDPQKLTTHFAACILREFEGFNDRVAQICEQSKLTPLQVTECKTLLYSTYSNTVDINAFTGLIYN